MGLSTLLMGRRRWAFAGAVGLCLALVFAFSRDKKPKLEFETARADRGDLSAKVTATGTLSALVTVQVGTQVSGRLQQILVDYNSEVQKGQVIAKIDPQFFQAAVEQGRANLLAARANLNKAKVQADESERQFQRQKTLADRSLIARAELDTAQANLEVARAQIDAAAGVVAQAQATLNQAEVNLAYTTIVSPITGTVISRNVDVGQTVAASFQSPTLFVIAEDLRKMQVDTTVAEADIGKLSAGMVATFTVDAYPNQPFFGKVRQIRNAPQTIQNVVTYDAVIDVDNPDLKLKPGMTASVTFVYAERSAVLRVPNGALRFKPTAEMLAIIAGGEKRSDAQAATRPDAPGGNGNGARADVAGPAMAGPQAEGPDGAHAGGPVPSEKPERKKVPRRTVWVLRAGVPQSVPIEAGISDGTRTEVVAGDLREGDELVIDVAGAASSGTRMGGGGPRPPGPFH